MRHISSFRTTMAATLVGGAMVATGGLVQTAAGQEVINLTAIDGYPPRSLWVKEFIEYFIPEVDRKLAETGNYKINWNQAWGGQIVKPRGVLEGIQLGLGDIGIVTTVFHPDKVPLQAIAYVTPFVTTDPGLVARTIDDLAAQFPEITEAFAEYNQVYLTNGVVLDSYEMFSKTPINALGDLSGLKVAGAGTNLRYLDGIGAVGVSGSLVGYYNNLQTGVVDAAMIWPEAAVTFKIVEVAPYMLDADIGTVNSKAVTVNADIWKTLPDEVKGVLKETSVAYRDHLAEIAAGLGAQSMASYEAAGGTVVKLPAEARAEWAAGMDNIAKEWAQDLDGKGMPGTEMLAAYMDAMRAAGQSPVRNWDQE